MSVSGFADLHIHTRHSDGTETPAEVVEKSARLGIECVAITDHDTCSGFDEALDAANRLGVELLPGIEVSACVGDKSVHILGYLMDMDNESMSRIITGNRDSRLLRMTRMVERLQALGYGVTLEDVLEYIGEGTLGRALLARYLVSKGFFKNPKAVFETILGDGKPVYEPVPRFTPGEVIGLIKTAGGVTSLAHPGFSGVDELLPGLVEAGLDAIEAYGPQHDEAGQRRYVMMAEKLGVLVTGGSDNHGPESGRRIGGTLLPSAHVESLKKRAAWQAAARHA
jgi:hypothetical protein